MKNEGGKRTQLLHNTISTNIHKIGPLQNEEGNAGFFF